MSLHILKSKLAARPNLSPQYGLITKITPTIIYAKGISPSVGDIVKITHKDSSQSLGIVTLVRGRALALILSLSWSILGSMILW